MIPKKAGLVLEKGKCATVIINYFKTWFSQPLTLIALHLV